MPDTLADLPSVLLGWLRPEAGLGVTAFEGRFAALHGGGRAYAYGAGRVALAAILDAFETQTGDEIIVPGYTCVAVPNPIIYRGALPVYADIEPETLNLDPADVARKITRRTRAILVQHTFGLAAPMKPFRDLADKHGLRIIEDCTHALGARYQGEMVGTASDAAFFSSEQSKVISTGSGGIAYTRDPSLFLAFDRFGESCSARSRAEVRGLLGYIGFLAAFQGPRSSRLGDRLDYYLTRVGMITEPKTSDEEMVCRRPERFLVRLSDGQARVGLSQLRRLEANLSRRRLVAHEYARMFSATSVRTFDTPSDCEPSWVRYPIRVDDKQAFFEFMRAHGVQVGMWFTAPVHPLGVDPVAAHYVPGSCPRAEDAVLHVANLPCHPRMSLSDARRVAKLVLSYRDARQT